MKFDNDNSSSFIDVDVQVMLDNNLRNIKDDYDDQLLDDLPIAKVKQHVVYHMKKTFQASSTNRLHTVRCKLIHNARSPSKNARTCYDFVLI